MIDFRTIAGASGLSAHQSGAFGTPTHWVITRHGAFVCATNSEIDARIMLHVLSIPTSKTWDACQRLALSEMGNREAA